MSMLRLQLNHTFIKRLQLSLTFMRNLSSPQKLLELLTDPSQEQLQLPLLHNSLLPQFNSSNLFPNSNLSHNRFLLQFAVPSPELASTILVREFLAVRRQLSLSNNSLLQLNSNLFPNSSLFHNSSCLLSPNRLLHQGLMETASTILAREFLAGSSAI